MARAHKSIAQNIYPVFGEVNQHGQQRAHVQHNIVGKALVFPAENLWGKSKMG